MESWSTPATAQPPRCPISSSPSSRRPPQTSDGSRSHLYQLREKIWVDNMRFGLNIAASPTHCTRACVFQRHQTWKDVYIYIYIYPSSVSTSLLVAEHFRMGSHTVNTLMRKADDSSRQDGVSPSWLLFSFLTRKKASGRSIAVSYSYLYIQMEFENICSYS